MNMATIIRLLCILLCFANTLLVNMPELTITAWNMHCMYNIAKPYVRKLQQDCDILVISEHGLFPCEVYKFNVDFPEYDCTVKTSAHITDREFGHRPGIGGCAIMWKKSLSHLVKPMDIENTDRIVGIKLKAEADCVVSVLGVYLPHSSCKISNFDNELAILENTILESTPAIVIGDTNCNISKLYGPRGSGVLNRNGIKLMNTMARCDMKCRDLQFDCQGPAYTYIHHAGETYIDHCMVSNVLYDDVYECKIIQDDIDNISDHLPLSVTLGASLAVPMQGDSISRNQIAWHKIPLEEVHVKYTNTLEEDLHVLLSEMGIGTPDGNSDSHVSCNNVIDKFIDCMKNASKNLPHTQFDKNLKPYWDKSLSELNKRKKTIRWEWISAGRPRVKGNPIWERYKESKREFRREQRHKSYLYETEHMQQLGLTEEIDQKYFWYMIKKKKKKPNNVHPIIDENGELLTNIDQIRDEWNGYYKELYTLDNDNMHDVEFDGMVNDVITDYYNTMEVDASLSGGPVTDTEVKTEINTMKNKKAPGHDNITAEHLKNLGTNGTEVLVWIMNSIIKNECIPPTLKKGLLCPLPKSGKDPSLKDHNRGITLLTTIFKLLEKIILSREKSWFSNICVDEQGSGVENCSSLHTSMLLQEAIRYNRNKRETVYTVFLDIRKAFDHVWIEGLLYKLHKIGINGKTWRLIRESYSNFECAAFIGGKNAEWFVTERGVHQGGPLSMMLYMIYINDLLQDLKTCMYGLEMFDIDVTCPSYADDMTSLALHKRAINELLQKANAHSYKWKYGFSHNKCNAMVWGIDTSPEQKIMLGNVEIELKMSVKHVGITLTNDKKTTENELNGRISVSRKLIHSARGLGSHMVPVSPSILSKLYWSVMVPRFTYGLEVCNLTESYIHELEAAHRQNAKLIQGLPVGTPNPAPLATLGWLSMATFIALKKILFIWKIVCLPKENIYRQIVTYLINSLSEDGKPPYSSPVYDMYRMVCKYGLESPFFNIMNDTEAANYMHWKSKIKRIVWQFEIYRWKASCTLYPELRLHSEYVHSIKMNMWWKFSQNNPRYSVKASAVVALLCGAQPKQLQRNLNSCKSECGLCKSKEKDDFNHVFINCPNTVDARNTFWSQIYDPMPQTMRTDLQELGKKKAIEILLSGLGQSYIREWDTIYVNIVNQTWEIYENRALEFDKLCM